MTLNEDESSPVTIQASDADGDILTYDIQASPQHGVVQDFNSSEGTFTYVPVANYSGPDSISVTATDPFGATGSGTVSITVSPVNDPPTVTLATDAPSYYEQASIFLTATGTDVDGDPITYSWSQLDGPPGQFFAGLASNQQEFWAPAITTDTTIHLQVQAQDSSGAGSTAQIAIALLAYHEVGGSILSNTTWSSPDGRPLEIAMPASVGEGVTLTIAPGTIVRALQAEPSHQTKSLAVAGIINAQGTSAQPIFFESVNPRHVQWEGIAFAGNNPSGTLSYVVIDHARTGIDLASTPAITVSDVVVRDCEWGIGDTHGYQQITLDHVTFLRNAVGYNVRTLEASTISNSLFQDNQSGADGTYTFDTTTFSGTSFVGNAVAVIAPPNCCGQGNVSATQNFWGTTSTAAIDDIIIDVFDDATLTEIPYQPFLSSAPANAGARLDAEITSNPPLN